MRQIRFWLVTIATLLCSITASAYDFEVDGIYYNLVSASELTVEVTRADIYNYYSGDISIPSTINYSGKTMRPEINQSIKNANEIQKYFSNCILVITLL